MHKIEEKWGKEQMESFVKLAEAYLSKGLMKLENGIYSLSNSGKLLADSIMSDFFIWIDSLQV